MGKNNWYLCNSLSFHHSFKWCDFGHQNPHLHRYNRLDVMFILHYCHNTQLIQRNNPTDGLFTLLIGNWVVLRPYLSSIAAFLSKFTTKSKYLPKDFFVEKCKVRVCSPKKRISLNHPPRGRSASDDFLWFSCLLCNIRKQFNSVKTSYSIHLVLWRIVKNDQIYNIFSISSENCLDL